MKTFTAFAVLVLILAGLTFAADREVKPAASQDGITVFFSPRGGCTEAIVEQIGKAKKSINVQAYRLTSTPIAGALVEAHKRGIKVQVVLDRVSQSDKYSDATFFANAGVPVVVDAKHAIAHNKVMILDEATVITGSFNFSKAAEESNAENLLIIEGKADITAAYSRNFAEHLAHAVAYKGVKPE